MCVVMCKRNDRDVLMGKWAVRGDADGHVYGRFHPHRDRSWTVLTALS